MPTARKHQVDLSVSNYYHCISRCVRRAFICGEDRETGKNFDHRKVWLVDKMKLLSGVFAIDICAYAVMSNHYHLVLRVDQEKAMLWSDREVIERWAGLFRLSKAKELQDSNLTDDALKLHQELIDTWRKQLYSISWFMRVLNEGIARDANKEDRCKGRFWESRFKSQVLLDEAAILTCMAYVDLNPVRANIAEKPEDSEFTSIQDRIKAYKSKKQPKELAPLKTRCAKNPLCIEIRDYFELVDETGRVFREGKRGAIPDHLRPILERLGISSSNWMATLQHFGTQFETFIGKPKSIKKLRAKRGHHRMRGLSRSEKSFLSAA